MGCVRSHLKLLCSTRDQGGTRNDCSYLTVFRTASTQAVLIILWVFFSCFPMLCIDLGVQSLPVDTAAPQELRSRRHGAIDEICALFATMQNLDPAAPVDGPLRGLTEKKSR
jgi:hypothetical protein